MHLQLQRPGDENVSLSLKERTNVKAPKPPVYGNADRIHGATKSNRQLLD